MNLVYEELMRERASRAQKMSIVSMISVLIVGGHVKFMFADRVFSEYILGAWGNRPVAHMWSGVISNLPGWFLRAGRRGNNRRKLVEQRKVYESVCATLRGRYPAITRVVAPRRCVFWQHGAYVVSEWINSGIDTVEAYTRDCVEIIDALFAGLPLPIAEEISAELFGRDERPYGLSDESLPLHEYSPYKPVPVDTYYDDAIAAYDCAVIEMPARWPLAGIFEPYITPELTAVVAPGLIYDDVEAYLQSLRK